MTLQHFPPITRVEAPPVRAPPVRAPPVIAARSYSLARAKLLSPALNPDFDPEHRISAPQGGLPISQPLGLAMDSPKPSALLSSRIERGENINYDELLALAKLLAEFHFSPFAKSLSQSSYENFQAENFCESNSTRSKLGILLVDQFVNHWKNKSLRFVRNSDSCPVNISTIQTWFDHMYRFIAYSENKMIAALMVFDDQISQYSQNHLDQIAILDGCIAIVPNEFKPKNEFTTRRMNAGSFRSELLLYGFIDEANCFWLAYEDEYSKKLDEEQKTHLSRNGEVAAGIRALDVVGEFEQFAGYFVTAAGQENIPLMEKSSKLIGELLNKLVE